MSFWKSKKVKNARKEHICEMCCAKIKVGDSCYCEVGVYEDEFNSYYLCDRCRKLLDNNSKAWLGDNNELIQIEDTLFELELIKCPECGGTKVNEWHYIDDSHLEIVCECSCGFKYKVNLSPESLINMSKKVDKI